MPQSTRNAPKRIEMQKKKKKKQNKKKKQKRKPQKLTSLTDLHFAQSLSGAVQPYLPHVTPRVQRSIHTKFHADQSKTVGPRGIRTNRPVFNDID